MAEMMAVATVMMNWRMFLTTCFFMFFLRLSFYLCFVLFLSPRLLGAKAKEREGL